MFDEKFWLAIAFFSFLFLIIKHVAPIIIRQLDSKSKQIAEEILAAKEAKEKADKILAASQERYQEATAFADKLIKDSMIEAQKYFEEALKNAESEISKKMIAVENRIKNEQENAVREIKIKIIESALRAVQDGVQNTQKDKSENLIKRAIDDVNKIVH